MSRRKRRGRGNKSRSLKKSIYILVDGESDQAYLQEFYRRYIRNKAVNLDIKPRIIDSNLNKKKHHLKEAIYGGYDYVFWLVDYDVILKEEREGAGTKAQLKSMDQRLLTEAAKVGCQYETLYMAPCLEFWFLLHFEDTTKQFSTCVEAERALKRHLSDYSKKPQWIRDQLIDKLSPNLTAAIEKAVKLYNSSSTNIRARADIGYLFKKLANDFKISY